MKNPFNRHKNEAAEMPNSGKAGTVAGGPKANKKKIILVLIIGVVVLAAALWGYSAYRANNAPVSVKAEKLSVTDLKRTVSADGQVVSSYTEQVTDTSGIPIWSIDVSVGNYVDNGTQLCTLYDKTSKTWSYITSPTSGTITAVSAVVGAPSSGVLFTIQRTQDLLINMEIKGADINTIESGMAVNITSDATGDRIYTGTVQTISPTSESTAAGSGATASQSTAAAATSASSGKILYNAVVSIDGAEDGLHIGMKTKQDVVVEQKTGAWTVSFDALAKDSQGHDVIYVVTDNGDGQKAAKAIPVTLGIQTDSQMEVQSSALTKDMLVITNPSGITDGQAISVEGENSGSVVKGA